MYRVAEILIFKKLIFSVTFIAKILLLQENMINSLRKDSHITRGLCIPNFTLPPADNTGVGERKQYCIAPENNSVGISVNKPAEINFRGLSSRTLANDAEFKTLVEAAKELVGKGKKQFKAVMQLMRDAADHLIPKIPDKEGKIKITEPTETVKKFVDSNKPLLQKMTNWAKELTSKDTECKINDLVEVADPKNPSMHTLEEVLNEGKLRSETIDSIYYATEAVPAIGKKHWYDKNPYLNKFLELADGNSIAFGALFALVLTGIFRPAAIMALPGDKKNKDDSKYAAAHSIASGVIGFIVSSVVSKPISDAIKKVIDKPQIYIRCKNGKLDYNMAAYYASDLKANSAVKHWVTRSVDIVTAIPKAFITIALIPPILKYVFGWEKKKHAMSPVNIQTNYNKNANDKKMTNQADGGIK